MYKVIIIDDEPRHRRGLANMIKELRPSYVVLEAKNGEEALQITQSKDINIMITDIKMPKMDGLQLMEQMGDKIRNIKVIILSGYNYFEYAQKAMRLGAFDYMLKPVDRSKVEEMLNKLDSKLLMEKKEKEEKDSLQKKLNEVFPFYEQHRMNKWIKGKLKNYEKEDIRALFAEENYKSLIITKINADILRNNYTDDEIDEIKNNTKYWFEQIFKSYGAGVSFFHEALSGTMISIVQWNNSFQISNENIKVIASEFIRLLQAEYEFSVLMAVSNGFKDIISGVVNAYNNAHLSMKFNEYYGLEKLIFYDELKINGSTNISKYREEYYIKSSIENMEVEKAQEHFGILTSRYLDDGYRNPEELNQFIAETLIDCCSTVEMFVQQDTYDKIKTEANEKLLNASSYQELVKQGEHFISELIEMIEARKNNKYESIIKKCKEYIELHYFEDISLDDLAERFYFNSSYFSNLFKNYTGVNISQFILKIRMEKAREILIKSSYKVFEVAKMVGYKDSKYFNRVFKKEFGLAPKEFRQIHVENQVLEDNNEGY